VNLLRVIVDANVVAAALIRPDGWTARELSRSDVEWFAPAFLLDELQSHASEYASKAGCGQMQWSQRLARLTARLALVQAAALVAVASHSLGRRAETVDPEDAVYLAAFVATEADLLWTRDAEILRAFPGIAVAVVPHATGAEASE
jgi:predicted nucleic acid-binding protein